MPRNEETLKMELQREGTGWLTAQEMRAIVNHPAIPGDAKLHVTQVDSQRDGSSWKIRATWETEPSPDFPPDPTPDRCPVLAKPSWAERWNVIPGARCTLEAHHSPLRNGHGHAFPKKGDRLEPGEPGYSAHLDFLQCEAISAKDGGRCYAVAGHKGGHDWKLR